MAGAPPGERLPSQVAPPASFTPLHEPGHIQPAHASRLSDPRRLETQLSEQDLARFLALRGDEDLVDLGCGTGFYTDRMAALTTGLVYGVELQPEMIELYRQRGIPANVRLVQGDVTNLALAPGSADLACCIAVYHETGGRLDLPGLQRILRPRGRLVIVDWRNDAESWEGGPPAHVRFGKDQVAGSLEPYFAPELVENLGRFMFAIVASRRDSEVTT
jgi:SAM-dependent methyltransferase